MECWSDELVERWLLVVNPAHQYMISITRAGGIGIGLRASRTKVMR
jgi:hypothetical protein